MTSPRSRRGRRRRRHSLLPRVKPKILRDHAMLLTVGRKAALFANQIPQENQNINRDEPANTYNREAGSDLQFEKGREIFFFLKETNDYSILNFFSECKKLQFYLLLLVCFLHAWSDEWFIAIGWEASETKSVIEAEARKFWKITSTLYSACIKRPPLCRDQLSF